MRHYLWGALVAALIPLIIIAALYDRYTVDLLDMVVRNRIENDLESSAARMNSFIAGQVNRLGNIIDLPDTTEFLLNAADASMTEQLSDFLLLETETPDVYAIEFFDLNGALLGVVPASGARDFAERDTTVPFVQHGSAEIIGPVMPRDDRPGWFLIQMPVFFDQRKIGIVALRMRLVSLTEQMAPLIEPLVYDPQLVVFDRVHVSAVGVPAAPGKTIKRSRQIMPGWRIHLVEQTGVLNAPRERIRYVLLVAAAASVLGLVSLFLLMSRRLTGYLRPLTQGAQAISNGEFGTEVPENAPGELGTVARSFNEMRRQLGAMIQSRVDMERRAAMGNMAAGIAHEIRNPITTVTTTLYGLKHGETDPERRHMYEEIADEIRRVDQTIGEMLNYARPSRPVRERVAIRDVFRSIKVLTAATMHEKGIHLNLLGDSVLILEIDQAHLRQILLNLTLNAIDALPDGGHISLRAHREDRRAVITVADTGIGMDDVTKRIVLRPFFTTKPSGTGLGLAVTNQLVDANGGEMDIESAPGKGTTVTLTFPLNASQRGRDEPDAHSDHR